MLCAIKCTYNHVRSAGRTLKAVNNWRYLQSCIIHAKKAKRLDCIGQDGNPMTHTRHLDNEYSDNSVNCTVKKTPQPTPAKKNATVNICHIVAKNANKWNASNVRSDANNAIFRPNKSASWPPIKFPTKVPAILIEFMVFGMKSYLQTRLNWNKWILVYMKWFNSFLHTASRLLGLLN